ncbi:MAG TPA: DUF2267 domain-containing protein [Beijerinckiaceae bacterium]|jgi:uncharacterized protein (DUF2267 family)
MSATGLDVFDKTLQTTNTWLDEITAELGPDRHLAWHALAAVLHALRDRLPLEVAVHLGAQLPLLVRGVYYDQWHLGGDVERYRSLEEFLERIGRGLQTTRPVSTLKAAQAVFAVLARHITDGQLDKVRGALPEDIRALSDLDAPRAA